MLRLRIDTDNDAFGSDPRQELGRILVRLSETIRDAGVQEGDRFLLTDSNGNSCGWATFSTVGWQARRMVREEGRE